MVLPRPRVRPSPGSNHRPQSAQVQTAGAEVGAGIPQRDGKDLLMGRIIGATLISFAA